MEILAQTRTPFMENRLFYYSLLTSLMIHIVVITYLSTSHVKLLHKPLKQIEVVYQATLPKRVPEKDIQLMQQALGRYKVNKIIIKRNLTKREMERFFSIDLRDLIRANQVQRYGSTYRVATILFLIQESARRINGKNPLFIPEPTNYFCQ